MRCESETMLEAGMSWIYLREATSSGVGHSIGLNITGLADKGAGRGTDGDFFMCPAAVCEGETLPHRVQKEGMSGVRYDDIDGNMDKVLDYDEKELEEGELCEAAKEEAVG
ncbi:hypothetical protein NDU88_003149 [Pleurodeles waltl]|uniref:Uncharacterized protein n=1 Tax=Pleurodeles waltl TaxID=8319 RepID=A0AAV7VD77_PLEWA|nr:hypothetical protein NDU88_003149 [Pleurodeles waltl]